MRRVVTVAVLTASLGLATVANAAWPERPVTVIVPFAAGGIADVVARLTAEQLQATFKQAFLVENQPGGAGIIAADRVAKARPDGYTLLSTPIFQITMAPFTHTVTFDPVKDFKPIAAIAGSPFVITVGGSFPAKTLADFIAYEGESGPTHLRIRRHRKPDACFLGGFPQERGARHGSCPLPRRSSRLYGPPRRPHCHAFGVTG